MKVLVLLPRYPYPILKGDKLRAFYQIQALSRTDEVHLLSVSEDPDVQQYFPELAPYVASQECISLSPARKYWNLAKGLFGGRPFQVEYFRHPRVMQRAAELMEQLQPDVVYVQLVRMTGNVPPGKNPSTARVLDYMDAMSAGMQKRIRLSGWWAKPFVKMEASRLQAYEPSIAKAYHQYTIISASDREDFPAGVQQDMHIVPNGIPPKFLQTHPPKPAIADLIFTGNMSYHPNVKAAEYLANKVLPLLKADFPDIKLYLVGTNPVPAVNALASDNVTVTGFVDDLISYLLGARLFVAPLFSGSGLQNKLLEAMALGLACITSPQANKALGAPTPDAIHVASTPEEFAASIRQLLDNEQQRAAVGKCGRNYVEAHFNWAAANEKLREVFQLARKKAAGETVLEPGERLK